MMAATSNIAAIQPRIIPRVFSESDMNSEIILCNKPKTVLKPGRKRKTSAKSSKKPRKLAQEKLDGDEFIQKYNLVPPYNEVVKKRRTRKKVDPKA